MATVYDVNNRDSTGVAKIVRELSGYDGFLSRYLKKNINYECEFCLEFPVVVSSMTKNY